MLIRSFILFLSLLLPPLANAAPTPLGIEMGKSTINDIKNMCEIEEQNYHRDGITYKI